MQIVDPLNLQTWHIYRCHSCTKVMISFYSQLSDCTIPSCTGTLNDIAQIVLADFSGRLLSYENLPIIQWHIAMNAFTHHSRDLQISENTNMTSQIERMINGSDPITIACMSRYSNILFFMIQLHVHTLCADLRQAPEDAARLLQQMHTFYDQHQQAINNMTDILEVIKNLISEALEYMATSTINILLCRGCNVISTSFHNENTPTLCTRSSCAGALLRLARLIHLEQNKTLLWNTIYREVNWHNAMNSVQRFPHDFQEEFAELSSVIWDCMSKSITINWKISYTISRIKIVYAILENIPPIEQERLLSTLNDMIHEYKQLTTALANIFIAITACRSRDCEGLNNT